MYIKSYFKNYLNKLLICAFLVISNQVNSDTELIQETPQLVKLRVTEAHTVGEFESIASAKEKAVQLAKNSAVEYAGTYVQTRMLISDKKMLVNEIQNLSAALIKVNSVSTKTNIDANGNLIIYVDTVLVLSKKEISEGLKRLGQNSKLTDELNKLQTENEQLRKELWSLAGIGNTSRIKRLKQFISLYQRIEENNTSIQRLFSEGELLFMAKQTSKKNQELKRKFVQDFTRAMMKTEVAVGELEFRLNSRGNHNLLVPIKWKVDKEAIKTVLDPYLKVKLTYRGHMHNYGGAFAVPTKQPAKYTKADIFVGELAKHRFYIKVSIGKKSQLLPITALHRSFGNETPYLKLASYYVIHERGDTRTKDYISEKVLNPVLIEDVDEKTLQTLTNIKAELVEVTQ
ncbi:hypothetical protein P7F88_17735 [Vibrio hannami]|uniref:hypothetical protein n=1 Tax=Vibrio hannami TaxID=2717094 RepID=UPI0024101958|nr:hypothetical protein [Vibrio hannami]MDG3087809.1 hypothetical protein [Vibrio hannami]